MGTREADNLLDEMKTGAAEAASFLKSLAHEQRLLLLCSLVECERNVGELVTITGGRQASISQQLARLRQQGLVTTRREGQVIWYRLADDRVGGVIASLHDLFCPATGREQ